MGYFRTLWPWCSQESPKGPNYGPDTPIAPTELVARFAVDKRQHIKWTNPPKAKEKLFEPDRIHNEVSVFRVQELDNAAICSLGESEVISSRKDDKKLLGWAILPVEVIKEAHAGLRVDATPNPEFPTHHRHANILGWPSDSDMELRKAARSSALQFLAAHAELVLSSHGKEVSVQKESA